MNTTTKLRPLSLEDCIECYAVPGSDSIIDVIHPDTGLTWVYQKTAEDVTTQNPAAVRMRLADWMQAKTKRQHGPITWMPTTREQYHEMLEVLPPAMWSGGAFLVGEPDDHDAETGEPRFRCYFHEAGAYSVASRPMTRRELKSFLSQKGIAV